VSDQQGSQCDSPSYSPEISRSEGEAGPILQACFEALEEFDTWDAEAEPFWKQTFEGLTVPAALGEMARSATYYDPQTACTIILIRSARLVLLLSLVEYHGRMQRVTGGEYGSGERGVAWACCIPVLERDIGSTIDDVLSSVPHALGDVDPSGRPASMACDGAGALVIMQSIRLVTHCCYATPEQLRTAQKVMHRIYGTVGIRSAVPLDKTSVAAKWFRSLMCAVTMSVSHDETLSLPLHE
jgi:hypothetical protein